MKRISLMMILVILFIIVPVVAADQAAATTPHTNDGRKWRIGYYESGPFASYSLVFGNIVKGLAKLGWLEGTEDFPFESDSKAMWQWLSAHDTGKYIEFVGDAYYSYNNKEELRSDTRERLLERLNQRQDIDLMLAMGTPAGQDMANDRHMVPTLVCSVSDAVKGGIVASNEDSGRNHIWAHCQPDRYKRQVELFHDIFHFKKLGIVYENSVTGRSFAVVDDVEALAKERGFAVVSEYIDESIDNADAYHQALTEAHRKVAEQADAVYLTLHLKLQADRVAEVLAPLTEKKIPTFSQIARDVPNGALMAVVTANYEEIGAFDADVLAKVLNGVRPRQLNQAYISPPTINLNLAVADRIGYQPPFAILLVADTVYQAVDGRAR